MKQQYESPEFKEITDVLDDVLTASNGGSTTNGKEEPWEW